MTDDISTFPQVAAMGKARSETIDRLRQLTQFDVQANWRSHLGDLPAEVATRKTIWSNWTIAPLNDRRHIAWGKEQVLWLAQQIEVPIDLHGYPLHGLSLRLALSWWAAFAQIFVNGERVQEGDLFDCATRILLSPAIVPGETVQVVLRLVSPSHDEGALVRSLCVCEFGCEVSADDAAVEPGFVADEFAVLQHYLTTFAPEKLSVLAAALEQIEWNLSDRATFDRSLQAIRQQLQPIAAEIKQRQVCLLGHAHLDLAWLWTVGETWEVAERTFRSVLQLQQDFPDLIFCHSTPALYAWVEQHRPQLFTQIQQQIAAGQWEVVAGLWVEPELNLVGGESIVRQVLYGQRYVREKFGKLSPIAWLPDSFGFCWQLPQILRQGGVEFFVTQKLRWNDTTEFPHELFWWQSPDGTQILSYNSPPIGEGIDPLKLSRYACTWETKTGISRSLWLPGVGDHGGGPTRDMLETARRWQRSPFFPTLKFTTADAYLQTLTASSPSAIPIWDDELYLEFHRGCYTTHAAQKRSNRRCEGLLYQAELFASIATLTTGAVYPQAQLEASWKQVLFNQFHDILPGSAISQVFVDANQAWQQAEQSAQQILSEALRSIAAQIAIALPQPPQPDCQPMVYRLQHSRNDRALPIVILNSLNWDRSEVVAVSLPPCPDRNQHWQIFDADGQMVRSQRQATPEGDEQLLFLADVPSIGYRVFWLRLFSSSGFDALNSDTPNFDAPKLQFWALENEVLIVQVDPATGDLSRVFDKIHRREVLSAPGNQLQAFQDQGQYWDAWNIDPAYAQHPLPPAQLVSIYWVDHGSLQQRLRVVRRIGQSHFWQDYVLEARSPVLKIVTRVDWRERHVLVKAAFPLTLQSDYATYEIPFGAIDRPTQPTTPQAAAKWEVPALQWADLSEADYGVSLINDCKYGYDSQPSQLRLTLLRGSEWPDPDADQGHHEFTYALYPHGDRWQAAETVRRGYELNQPLLVATNLPSTFAAPESHAATLASGTFLSLRSPSLVLTAFKRSEDDPNRWMLRCYESQGKAAIFSSENSLSLQMGDRVDLLEQPVSASAANPLEISPWSIVTYALRSVQSS